MALTMPSSGLFPVLLSPPGHFPLTACRGRAATVANGGCALYVCLGWIGANAWVIRDRCIGRVASQCHPTIALAFALRITRLCVLGLSEGALVSSAALHRRRRHSEAWVVGKRLGATTATISHCLSFRCCGCGFVCRGLVIDFTS